MFGSQLLFYIEACLSSIIVSSSFFSPRFAYIQVESHFLPSCFCVVPVCFSNPAVCQLKAQNAGIVAAASCYRNNKARWKTI